jgi:hypothetical protein
MDSAALAGLDRFLGLGGISYRDESGFAKDQSARTGEPRGDSISDRMMACYFAVAAR